MYVCMYVCMHVCMYVCMYVCVCIHIHIYIYIYIYVHTGAPQKDGSELPPVARAAGMASGEAIVCYNICYNYNI